MIILYLTISYTAVDHVLTYNSICAYIYCVYIYTRIKFINKQLLNTELSVCVYIYTHTYMSYVICFMLSNPRMAANEALKACEDAEEDRRQVRIQVFVHLGLAWGLDCRV